MPNSKLIADRKNGELTTEPMLDGTDGEFLAPLQHRIEQALTTSLSQPTASHYLTEAMRYAT